MAGAKYRIEQAYPNFRRFGEVSVYQVGRLHCGAGMVIPEHPQRDYFEFTVVTDGKGINITDGVAVPIEKGDIYISFAGDFHSIISDADEPLKYDFLTVQTEDAEILGGIYELMEKNHDADMRTVRSEKISRLVSEVISEMNGDSLYSEKLVEATVKQILIYFIREMNLIEHPHPNKDVTEADIVCFKVMYYIDSHIYTIKKLRELSEITSYSYNYLSNLFKKTTSGTLREYFNNRRLETARLLLVSDDATVTEAAEMLGYSSVYSFSTSFKKKYGLSPSSVKSGGNKKNP